MPSADTVIGGAVALWYFGSYVLTGQEEEMTAYDAIIIGTGQAGPPLARRLAGTGMKVAIVERGRFGGTCVNTGCTPTKTLVASAYAVHLARRGADYGFSAGDVTVGLAPGT
jgi:pyruvate/2-oxoglutarate dehydrogenase complex dihydrolipoamide dehydrogenase (E3) component